LAYFVEETMNHSLMKSWSTAWEGGEWGPAWKGAFEGLSAAQAAWVPEGVPGVESGRVHSVWQILNHIVYWRGVMVAGLESGPKLDKDEIARKNWEAPAPGDVSEAAWSEAKARYAASHRLMADAIASSDEAAEKLRDMLLHDAYHMGQVFTMRALMNAEGGNRQ
jgi:hypothetical protein